MVRFASERYPGTNHTHLRELLWEHEGLDMSRFTVRRILQAAGMPGPHQRRRPSTACDARGIRAKGCCYRSTAAITHDDGWAGRVAPRFTLLLSVGDATGDVPYALFRPAEGACGYFTLMEQIILRRGLPLSPYTDRHGVFQAPPGWEGQRPPT